MALEGDPVLDVFREVMGNNKLQVTDASTFEDVPAWDSVAHVNLISALEERFGVNFSVAEIVELNSVGAIREALTRKMS
jgi:acyl carrier protein